MMPVWAMKLDWRDICQAADAHELSPFLVAAVVMTESAGNTFATRYEPKFRWVTEDAPQHAKRLGITLETEHFQQMTSWGLMQVMLATARGLGFTGHAAELTIPDVGLDFGCRYLKAKTKGVSVEQGLSAYNSGTARKTIDGKYENQNYVDKVMKYLKELEGSF